MGTPDTHGDARHPRVTASTHGDTGRPKGHGDSQERRRAMAGVATCHQGVGDSGARGRVTRCHRHHRLPSGRHWGHPSAGVTRGHGVTWGQGHMERTWGHLGTRGHLGTGTHRRDMGSFGDRDTRPGHRVTWGHRGDMGSLGQGHTARTWGHVGTGGHRTRGHLGTGTHGGDTGSPGDRDKQERAHLGRGTP